MKYLVGQVHHHHLKKRAWLELAGLLGLIIISYTQRDLIVESFNTISGVNAGWFVIILGLYWLFLPFTAISYRLISPKPKKLNLKTTILAHLAGAGPGRVIPGGIGNLSISAFHLKKSGLSIEQSVAVVVTNNVIGFLTNLILLISVMFIRPETLQILTDNIYSWHLIYVLGAAIFLLSLFLWLNHARQTRRETHKTVKQWRRILLRLIKNPAKLCGVIILALGITLFHTYILYFASFALGHDLLLVDAFVALSIGVAIGGVLPTPGGVGGVEAGTIATLVILGYGAPEATSMALLLRISTYGQPLIPGTLAYYYLREKKLV